jgi:hypothetical protein
MSTLRVIALIACCTVIGCADRGAGTAAGPATVGDPASAPPAVAPPPLPRPVQPRAAKAAAELIKIAIDKGDALATDGKVAEAIAHYYKACREAVRVLGEGTDVGVSLLSSFQHLPSGGEDSPMTVAAMRSAMDAAYLALTFDVIEEAPPPAGFPPPGRVGIVTLRHYPACRTARLAVTNQEAQAPMDALFAPLAAHMAGKGLALTRPWVVWFGGPVEDPAAVGVFYPVVGAGAAGRQGGFVVADLPAVTVVSLGFVGVPSQALVNEGTEELRRWVGKYRPGVQSFGPTRMLMYNSAKTPAFLRYWELQAHVFETEKPREKKR